MPHFQQFNFRNILKISRLSSLVELLDLGAMEISPREPISGGRFRVGIEILKKKQTVDGEYFQHWFTKILPCLCELVLYIINFNLFKDNNWIQPWRLNMGCDQNAGSNRFEGSQMIQMVQIMTVE